MDNNGDLLPVVSLGTDSLKSVDTILTLSAISVLFVQAHDKTL